MKNDIKTTLKAWPVIALATIGLCFLTQKTAELLGFPLPDQQHVDVVRKCLLSMFSSKKSFYTCLFLLAQVLFILPFLEELLFRWLIFKFPIRKLSKSKLASKTKKCAVVLSIISSVLFSAAHYITQPFPDAAFVALFYFGLAQSYLYMKTDRLLCIFLNHMLFNLTNVVLVLIVPA